MKLRESSKFVTMRHALHQIPELGFEEIKTSKFITEKLRTWGYQVHQKVGITGIVATMTCGHGDKTLGLRADMDALPITENLTADYKSIHSNRAHACGHDGHSAMLLGAAKILAESKDFNGTLTLIFQPAEETMAGAMAMIEDGLFTRFPMDAIFGMHNMPMIDEGSMMFSPGASMAAVDNWSIELKGRGAHGSMPEVSIDAVVACCALVMQLQTIVSRNIAPLDSAVVTVGSVNAGTAGNIIADSGVVKISVRTINPESRTLVLKKIVDMVESIALAYGVSYVVDKGTPGAVLINDEEMTKFSHDVAVDILGKENVSYQNFKLMGSEDFAFYGEHTQASYCLIGSGKGRATVHHPDYDFDDQILIKGTTYWVRLAEAFLK